MKKTCQSIKSALARSHLSCGRFSFILRPHTVLHTIVGLREGTIISAVLVGMSVRFFSRWTRRLALLFWEKEKLEKARRRRLVLQESYAA